MGTEFLPQTIDQLADAQSRRVNAEMRQIDAWRRKHGIEEESKEATAAYSKIRTVLDAEYAQANRDLEHATRDLEQAWRDIDRASVTLDRLMT